MAASSCKTKKKSTPAAAPAGGLTPEGGDSCENPLALFNVEGLPKVSASQLKVDKVIVEEPSVGNSEKVYISQAKGSATPDLYIYRGHKSTKESRFAAPHKGVTRATCQPSASNEECFTGLTYSGLNINSNLPDGALRIEAWACIGSGGSRKITGQSYTKVAYGDTVYFCGEATESRDNNKHTRKSSVEDRLGQINDAIKHQCQSAYNKLTSAENLKAAKDSSDTVLKSLNGLVAMGQGAFISNCLLNLEGIVSAVSYAESKQQKSGSSLALTNTDEECAQEVPEEEFEEYVNSNPPPVISDPVAVIPPVEPEPVPEPEPEPVAEEPVAEEPEASDTPTKRDLCKQRGETLAETIGGSTEWVPDVSSEDKENNGTCFINHEDGSQTQIEPSIAEQPNDPEPEPAPTQSNTGRSATQKWGIAFMVIGGAAASSAYLYSKSPGVQQRVDSRFADRGPEEMDNRRKIEAYFDDQIRYYEQLEPEDVNAEKLRNAQLAELNNRRQVVLLSNELAITRSKMDLSPEAWRALDGSFNGVATYTEPGSGRFEISTGKYISNEDFEKLKGTAEPEKLKDDYEKWDSNRTYVSKYFEDYEAVLAEKQNWDGPDNEQNRKLLQDLDNSDSFKSSYLDSRTQLNAINDKSRAWTAFEIDGDSRLVATTNLPDSIKPVTVPKGSALEARANFDPTVKGKFSGYVKPGVYGGLAVFFLGTTLAHFGLADSGKYDPTKAAEREAAFLAALSSCSKQKKPTSGCDKVIEAALK